MLWICWGCFLLCFLQDLERQESEFQSYSNAKHSQLQAEIIGLEEKTANGYDSKSLTDGLDRSLSESVEVVNSATKVVLIVERGSLVDFD